MSGNPKKQAEVSYYSSIGLKYDEVEDNGNCLYDAVAKALNTTGRPYTKTELMTQRQQLRNQISQYLNTSIFIVKNKQIIEAVTTVVQAKLLEQYHKDLKEKKLLISSGHLTEIQISGVQREIAALNKRLGDGINPTPQEIRDHLESIRAKEWGDQLAIQALSKCLRRPIIVVTSNSTKSTIDITKIGEENTTNPPIFVHFNGINHYDALIIQPEHNSNKILQSLLQSEQQHRSKATDRYTTSSRPTTSSPSTPSTSSIGNSRSSSFEFDERGTVARGKSLIQPEATTGGGRIGTSSSAAQKAMGRLMDSPEKRITAHRKFLGKVESELRKEALNKKIEMEKLESAKRPQTAPSKSSTSITQSTSVRPTSFRDKPLINNYTHTPPSERTGKVVPQPIHIPTPPVPTPSSGKAPGNYMHEFPGEAKIKPEQPTHIPGATPPIPRSGYSSDKKPPQQVGIHRKR